MGKIVSKAEFRDSIRPALKKEKKTIALCHGVFDLIHPGHITHLEQAKAMADVLVVSITAAKYVRKGPDRPYFNDTQRAHFLSSIACVDYVMVSDGYTVDDIVESVEPDYYVKGSEYRDENADVTANMKPERELVEKHGGRVRYTGGQTFSSTKLINRGLSALPDDVIAYMERFRQSHTLEEIVQYADKARNLRVLVLGDVIIDRYTYCDMLGLMSKNMAYSTRLLSTEDYLGGSVAVARHLSSFCQYVTLVSVIGNEPEIIALFHQNDCQNLSLKLFSSPYFSTIVKQRYLVPNEKRSEYTKVFAINNIPENPQMADEVLRPFKETLGDTLSHYDAVFLCDFGHGLITQDIKDLVQEQANYLILNCQTNSTNYGMNLITKYRRADAFTVDQRELRLALPDLAREEQSALKELAHSLSASQAFLTRGSKGAYGYSEGELETCPAFTLTVSDTIGAGDAFYSVAGLFSAAGAPLSISTVLGNIAGALGANIIGNKQSVQRTDVLKFASTLLNV